MSNFGSGLRKFSRLFKGISDNETREIGLFALGKVITKTPVDHGTAKGNWFTAVDSVNRSVDESRRAGTALSEGAVVIHGFKSGGVLNISNSLPYINRLEHGFSDQAPSGMVKVTELEIVRFIQRKSKRV